MDPIYSVLELNAWRSWLWHQGHQFVAWNGFETPDIIGVICSPQDFLKVSLRFLCSARAEDVFRVLSCPEPHRSRWLEIANQLAQRPSADFYSFLAGPGSWMLTRLVRFGEVVFWSPGRGLGAHGIDDFRRAGWGVKFSPEAAPFFPTDNEVDSLLPRQITVAQDHFADVVAACFPLAFDGQGCYIADAAGTEVYWVDNDEVIIASIPDAIEREKLLRELEETPWPFINVSGCSGKEANFIFGEDSIPFGPEDYVAHIPASLSSKEELFVALIRELKLPAYFGKNWDALWDCLCDLSWIKSKRVLIVHADIPRLDNPAMTAYLNVLHQSCRDWMPMEDRQLLIVFPKDVREQVFERLPDSYMSFDDGVEGERPTCKVRSIPSVMAFKGGERVVGFTGHLPESRLRDLLDGLVLS